MSHNILNFGLVLKFIEDIGVAIDFFGFFGAVGVNEFLNPHKPTTNPYQNPISLLHFDVNSFLAEFVDALGFAEEHDVELFPLRILINKASYRSINRIIFMSDIYHLSVLKFATDIM
jgi:hypothetical protein